ncbi:dynein axonemal heavy chain 9-like [Melanerpes formicivorus]|uniref:dynein axonemal heavy chain 9-like n=1 Tax=Melanerpes formicivorus TaxID=211600 RepID=UPI00358E763F
MTWCQTVSEKSQYNLTQPLLRRDPDTKLLAVNFDPQLVSVLREVRYLSGSQVGAIPPAAADIYSCKESYRELVAKLELMVSSYNKVLKTVLEVEYPLIQGQLQDIDLKLKEAEESLNWKMEGVWDHISRVVDAIQDLEQRTQRARGNVEEIRSTVQSWVAPILERKDSKKESLLSLEDCQGQLERHYSLVRESGQRIHSLLKENQSLLLADPASDIWKAYVEYLDEIVLDGFYSATECSLKYLLDNTDPEAGLAPLFEVQLDLVVPELVFYPSLDPGASDGFYEMMESLLAGIYRSASLVPRLAQHSGCLHYQADVEAMAGLAALRRALLARVQAVLAACSQYRSSLQRFAALCAEERREACGLLPLRGRGQGAAEGEAPAEEGLPEGLPSLQHFKEQIEAYERVAQEVSCIQAGSVCQGWLRVDARPLKLSLLSAVRRGSLVFKQHLVDHVTHSLADLEEFIKTADKGLSKKVEKGDSDGLVEIMGHLLAVKERQSVTDAMFEPLKQTIELLMSYEQPLPEEIYKQLEELPEKWSSLKKLSLSVKQQVAPLQASEMAAVRRSAAAFDAQQQSFRQSFRREAPFSAGRW